jgi:uncharacterized protein YjbI with pentapeptide repeats
MANPEYVDRLKAGVSTWNEWRHRNLELEPDLSGVDLSSAQLVDAYLGRANLAKANLSRANLSGANLGRSDLTGANLSHANLYRAILSTANLTDGDLTQAHLREAQLNGAILERATLSGANLRDAFLTNANLAGAKANNAKLIAANLNVARLIGADLTSADLKEASLRKADLSEAILNGCDMERAVLVDTRMVNTQLVNCSVYGIDAWNLDLTGAKQDDLIVTPADEPVVTVDDLEVAQFIYLLLNNKKIRNVIDTVTSKAVLILGRFTPERKVVLDALRHHLRQLGLLPILFDFDKSSNRTIMETVSTLASLARFVIADITDPKSIPQELGTIVKEHPSIPVQPILQDGYEPWSMYESIIMYDWVLDLVKYRDLPDLLLNLSTRVIQPAERRAHELELRLRAVRQSLAVG